MTYYCDNGDIVVFSKENGYTAEVVDMYDNLVVTYSVDTKIDCNGEVIHCDVKEDDVSCAEPNVEWWDAFVVWACEDTASYNPYEEN